MNATGLAALEGVDVDASPDARELLSQDISGVARESVAAVARPRDADALCRLVAHAAATGTPLLPRGGGMSYTRGYVADSPSAVVVDLRGLDAIESVDTANLVAVVQPGVTWARLQDALAPHGLCARFRGPLSGQRSTVGGGASQNAVFWGTGRYGTFAETVLGLEVVTGRGDRLRTGALADASATPFFRTYGPDPTGLFVGDGGAFGIKTRIAVALRAAPVAEGTASFSFDAAGPLLAAMGDIARADLVVQQSAFDPLLVTLRTRRQSLAEDFRTLTGFLRGSKSLTRGLKDAASMVAAGRGFLEDSHYLLHCFAEARGPSALREDLAAVRTIAQRHGGREIDDSIAKVMAATPFPALNGIVGPAGERWAPVHGLVPLSAAEPAYRALIDLLAAHEDTTTCHTISCGTLFATVGTQAVVMEPMFFWPDALERLHRETLEPRSLARIPPRDPQPEARAAVGSLRRAFVDAMRPFGAAHLQLGRFYPWLDARDAAFRSLIHGLKRELDPDGILNPGVLGLGTLP